MASAVEMKPGNPEIANSSPSSRQKDQMVTASNRTPMRLNMVTLLLSP